MNYMTTKMKVLIIDDEAANRNVLNSLLNLHCPGIDVVGFAESADEGYQLITEKEPDLVFLDIKMPVKTGFDLLRMFEKINFNVIFISGFDQYAIQAFEFSAVDYILKPIDYAKLISAVKRAEDRVREKNDNHIIHFIDSLDEKNQLIKNISLHHNGKVHVVNISDICSVNALRGYCEISVLSGQKLVSAKTLTDYEELLKPYPNFLRVNKGTIININHLKNYSKGTVCYITMKGADAEIEVSRRRKTTIIQYLKDHI
ncbi:MAG: two component transcriptional regulator, LytTR family [Bacteroidetes bacterium]|nr:two component transcriptional regulator, LytTR family [Bacteroidota bacterium]